MEDKLYRHPRFGLVKVLIQPNYKAGGPRNVLIRLEDGTETIVPQRSLRNAFKSKSLEREMAVAEVGP